MKHFLSLDISIFFCINVSSCSFDISYTVTRDLKSILSSEARFFNLDKFSFLRSTYLMNMPTQRCCSFRHLVYVDNNAVQ